MWTPLTRCNGRGSIWALGLNCCPLEHRLNSQQLRASKVRRTAPIGVDDCPTALLKNDAALLKNDTHDALTTRHVGKHVRTDFLNCPRNRHRAEKRIEMAKDLRADDRYRLIVDVR